MEHMDLLDRVKQETGKVVTPAGHLASIVLETPEFRRIRDLERRDWSQKDVDELVPIFTQYLKTIEGTQTLRPAQAAALRELVDCGGLFAPIRVGGGKTLVSFLAPVISDAKRALLLVPANLLEKTKQDLRKAAKHWRVRPMTIESYEMLSRDRTGRILEGLRPDLIIADEAHKLKNTSAGCTKRLSRYLQAARRLEKKEGSAEHHVTFVAMSGTITTRSLREYWHLIRWALREGAPLPSDVDEFQQWAQALDERVSPESRWQPGALERLSPNPKGEDVLKRARNAYAERLISCPGVISTRGEIPPMSLNIFATPLEAPPDVAEAIAKMRATCETPDGHPFETPLELYRHCREMQCFGFQRWDPPAPREWLEHRRSLSQFIRETLKHSHKYATPGDIIKAVLSGDLDDHGIYARWQEIKPIFKPHSVPFFVHDLTLDYAANWLSTGKADSKLCWTEFAHVGPRLSEMTGIPYFGEGGLDSNGNAIDDRVGPAIVSLHTCSTGRNLQYRHSQNLYLTPPSKNDQWEQSLGRTHRDGQPEDEVTAEVLLMTIEAYRSLVYAVREAEYTTESTLEPQKLYYATRDLGSVEALIGRRNDEMWKEELQGV